MCDCEFHEMDETETDPDDYPPWHYLRLCNHCGKEWLSLHCAHDGFQNPCPHCGHYNYSVV